LVSDWNHGNAHFLRGIATALLSRGHVVDIYEPLDSWSRGNLLRDQGESAVTSFQQRFPHLRSTIYDETDFDLDSALLNVDVVIVHEWNKPELVAKIGNHRAKHDYKLFFHDTHHRSLTDKAAMAQYQLQHYNCVLAYGNVIRDAYLANGWARDAVTWHEAADTSVFYPIPGAKKVGDLVWIGNWGDGERAESLREFLIEPVKKLGLTAKVYGVRYPAHALQELAGAGIEYGGWLPNYQAPDVFASYRVTVHVPRGPYVSSLPGIPTIRPFEALACGIPLISAPWNDSEQLFRSGDFRVANDGSEMVNALKQLLGNPQMAARLSACGLATIQSRHTCGHRAEELLSLVDSRS